MLPSLPAWERGLKFILITIRFYICVAPRVGAWIEILIWGVMKSYIGSLPAWERGLKLIFHILNSSAKVAPRVGAWIEISVVL